MTPRRSLAFVAAAATAITLIGLPSAASAAGPPALSHSRHVAARSIVAEPPQDAKVTSTIGGVPDAFVAGEDPTPITVTYTNTGTTNYPYSALAFDVYDEDSGKTVTPNDFTITFQFPGGEATTPAAEDCVQQTTDGTYSDVSCALDPGDDLPIALNAGQSVTVTVNLAFKDGFTAADAQLGASAVLYTSDNENSEVNGPEFTSGYFAVEAPAAASQHAATPAVPGRLGLTPPAVLVR